MPGLPPWSPFLATKILWNVVVPLIVWQSLLPTTHSTLLSLILRLLALVSTSYITSWIHRRKQDEHARRLGARSIPRVKGRWPLNLDVVAGWRAAGTYVGGGMVAALGKEYGKTLNTRAMGEDSLITTDASHIQSILASPSTFPKGPKYHERVRGMLGNGIFAADGEQWRARRAVLQPYFARMRMEGLEESVEKHARRLVEAMMTTTTTMQQQQHGDKREAGSSFDMQRLAGSFALGVASDVLFGSEVSSMPDDVVEAFNQAQRVVADRIKIGTLWAVAEVWTGDRLRAPMRVIRAWTRGLKARPGTLLEYLRKGSDDDDDDDALFAADEEGEEEIVNILLAARDTTASALTSCAYCMAMHPDKVPPSAGGGGAQLREFVLEVLRLYPPVPLNIRRTSEPCVIDGLYYPRDTSIILGILQMQRDPEVWRDADTFDPERWNPSSSSSSSASASASPPPRRSYAPFNAGPRACLGQAFAMRQIEGALAKIMAMGMQLEVARDTAPKEWKEEEGRASIERAYVVSGLTLSYKGGLWLKVKES